MAVTPRELLRGEGVEERDERWMELLTGEERGDNTQCQNGDGGRKEGGWGEENEERGQRRRRRVTWEKRKHGWGRGNGCEIINLFDI